MSASSEIEGCTAGSDKDAVLASRVVVRERLQLMRTIAAHIYSLALRGCLRLVLRKKRHQGLERNIMSKEKCQQMHDDVKHVAARWRRSCSGSIVSDIIRRSFLSSPKGKFQVHAFLIDCPNAGFRSMHVIVSVVVVVRCAPSLSQTVSSS